MTITFQKERFTAITAELPDIFYAHWKEIAVEHSQIKLDPDWARYATMDNAGILHMLTVRDDGILVGYYLAIVMPHLHYKSTLMAWSDLIYLLPDYRKSGQGMVTTGQLMLEHAEAMLKTLGVKRSYLMTKSHLPINMLMKRLGYKLRERTFTKLL